MEVAAELLFAVLRIAVAPLLGYGVIRLARRWPLVTLSILVSLIALGSQALCFAAHEGINVHQDTRQIDFGSATGRWCYSFGALFVVLAVPALPLIAFARAPNGTVRGPVGGQWAAVLFGYFMACFIFSAAMYSWLTGIVK